MTQNWILWIIIILLLVTRKTNSNTINIYLNYSPIVNDLLKNDDQK